MELKNVEVKIICDLIELNKESFIIPYGIIPSFKLLKAKYNTKFCLMIDAYSVGWFNKIIFYIKRKKIFYYDLYYSIYQLFRYGYKEFIVLKEFQNIIYASAYDVNLVKRIFPKKNYYVVPNGVDIHFNSFIKDKKDGTIVLGTISNWNKTALNELSWFIEDYFWKLRENHSNIKLLVAGLSENPDISEYLNAFEGVTFIGEVKNLADFFNKIDIFIATVPKGVGILNKVLDAFSYKKIVIGLPQCFNSFPDLKNGFLTFNNFYELNNCIHLFKNDKLKISKIVETAYSYILKNNNWEKNYCSLIDLILDTYQKQNLENIKDFK